MVIPILQTSDSTKDTACKKWRWVLNHTPCLQRWVLTTQYCTSIIFVGKWDSFCLTECWLDNYLGSNYLYLDILNLSYFLKFRMVSFKLHCNIHSILWKCHSFPISGFLWLLFHLMKNFKWDIKLAFKKMWKIYMLKYLFLWIEEQNNNSNF